MWNAIFSALSVILCCLCLAGCLLVVRNVHHDSASERAKLRSYGSRIESLELSRDEAADLMLKMANSEKMKRVRAAQAHAVSPAGDPDPYKQPDEWRKAMNLRLAEAKHGVKR